MNRYDAKIFINEYGEPINGQESTNVSVRIIFLDMRLAKRRKNVKVTFSLPCQSSHNESKTMFTWGLLLKTNAGLTKDFYETLILDWKLLMNSNDWKKVRVYMWNCKVFHVFTLKFHNKRLNVEWRINKIKYSFCFYASRQFLVMVLQTFSSDFARRVAWLWIIST